jgi:protein-disulfide isomerase
MAKQNFWQQNKVNLIGWLVVILVIAGAAVFSLSSQKQVTEVQTEVLELDETDHVRGAAEARVQIMEYADFQCPACATYHSVVAEVLAKYPDDVSLVFRHFPLTNIHPNAVSAGKAAEAAGGQDAFWEMYDLLFTRQAEWSTALDSYTMFEGYANELGLDTDAFGLSFNSGATLELVMSDSRGADALRLTSTPTFFINGEQVSVTPSIDAFSELIDPWLLS